MSLEGGQPTPGAVPSTPSTGSTPRPPGSAPAVAGPPGGGQRTQPTELDEFLARAVDRQIAEQRALRESLQELSAAVKELQSRPPPPAPSLDLADLDARIRRGMDANAQAFNAQLREFSSSILPEIARATENAKPSRAIEHDMSILRDAIGGLSADVEGIAQALIDLNAGLRDWAEGVDRNIGGVRTSVDHLREVATRTEQLQSEAVQLQSTAVQQQAEAAQLQAAAIATAEERLSALQASAVAAVEERFATQHPAEVAVGELVHVPEEVAVPVAPQSPVELTLQRDVSAEIEQRVKETVELSLYLADQIESFDRAISNLGNLPTRLEGVIAQALKRTLAARAKLDREAEMALDEVVATLDEHVGHIGDMSLTAEGIRDVANGQTEIAFGLRALAEAIDRSSEGRAPRASSAIAKTTRRLVSDEDLPPARAARSKGGAKAKPARSKAKPTTRGKTKANAKAKTSTSSAARRGSRKAAPRKTPADYIDIDLDAD